VDLFNQIRKKIVIFVHFKGFSISQKTKSSPLSYFAQKTSLKLLERAKVDHCNRVPVSINRYGVEKTVDTHKILINAIKFYVCRGSFQPDQEKACNICPFQRFQYFPKD
jgi:hypothetical protein